MAVTRLYVIKVRVQEYRRNFYHEQQSARTVPKENNLVCYLEVNSPIIKDIQQQQQQQQKDSKEEYSFLYN
jgi:hypothetical protein